MRKEVWDVYILSITYSGVVFTWFRCGNWRTLWQTVAMLADQKFQFLKKFFYSLKVLYIYTRHFSHILLLLHPTNLHLSPSFMSFYLFILLLMTHWIQFLVFICHMCIAIHWRMSNLHLCLWFVSYILP